MLFGQFKYIPALLFFLFILVSSVFANAQNLNKTGNDTIPEIRTPQEIFSVPKRIENEVIDFRINSDIKYLSFKHFVKNESLKLFFQAWLKEKELKNLSKQTDSLRHIYSTADNQKREEISSLILQAEQKTINLNQEIPEMYEKARIQEDIYWQSATGDELAKFRAKTKVFADSLAQLAATKDKVNLLAETEKTDTLELYKPSANNSPAKVEEASPIIYKIQIGAFKSKIPDTANKLIKKLSLIRNIEKQTDSKGVTIYTTGNLKSYEEAVVLQNQVKQEGAKNPIITAYKNGKRIPVEDAKK